MGRQVSPQLYRGSVARVVVGEVNLELSPRHEELLAQRAGLGLAVVVCVHVTRQCVASLDLLIPRMVGAGTMQ